MYSQESRHSSSLRDTPSINEYTGMDVDMPLAANRKKKSATEKTFKHEVLSHLVRKEICRNDSVIE